MTLTTNGKNYIAQKFGINNCYVSSGLNWTYLGTDNNTYSDSGGTAQIVSRLVMTSVVQSVMLAGTVYTYTILKTNNDNTDINLSDAQWITQNDGSTGSQYCYILPTPSPTPTTIPSPSPGIMTVSFACPNGVNINDYKTISPTITGGTYPYSAIWHITKPDMTADTRNGNPVDLVYQFVQSGVYSISVSVVDFNGIIATSTVCNVSIACPVPMMGMIIQPSGSNVKATSYCPTSLNQGSLIEVILSLLSPGYPPYTYKLYRDGNLETYGPISDLKYTFILQLTDITGSHTYIGEITDSCPAELGGPKTISQVCTFSVVTPVKIGFDTIGMIAIVGLAIGAIYKGMKK